MLISWLFNFVLLLTCLQRADLAIGSFTINYMREQVIDMTKPFMHIGISILYKVKTTLRFANIIITAFYHKYYKCIYLFHVIYKQNQYFTSERARYGASV